MKEHIANIACEGRSFFKTGSLVDLGSGDGRIVIAAAQRGRLENPNKYYTIKFSRTFLKFCCLEIKIVNDIVQNHRHMIGMAAVGYEINPWLVWQSRRAAQKAGVSDRASFVFFLVLYNFSNFLKSQNRSNYYNFKLLKLIGLWEYLDCGSW